MESLGHNYNTNSKDLLLFMKHVIFKETETECNEKWLGDISMPDIYWNNITDKLSKIEQCDKIIKTKDNNNDMILFITENLSTRYVQKVLSVYDSVLSPQDKYFDILVLSNEEFKAWENNEENVVYWENADGRM